VSRQSLTPGSAVTGCGVAWGMNNPRAEIVFVDVDDTLVRSAGTKRIPITPVVERVKGLKRAGATLYCWSTGGAEYARDAALELGLEGCFVAFLPKPTVILDDQAPAEWRMCRHVHPFNVTSIETEP
jgi:hypothetical protein